MSIAGRFYLKNSIHEEVLLIKTFFDATKATDEELEHIEGFYSYHSPKVAKVINENTIKLFPCRVG